MSAQLSRLASEVFLPLLKTEGRTAHPGDLAPLFPQYVFLRCDLTTAYYQIRYAPGVASFVTTGNDPLPVPGVVVESVRARCVNNVVHLSPEPFRKGEPIRILSGPLRGFDAVFERYMSGAERVAILLNTAERSLRVIASARQISR